MQHTWSSKSSIKPVIGQSATDQIAFDAFIIVINDSGNHFRQGSV